MKVIFLDFDGVLNSEKWRRNPDLYLSSFIEPAKMDLLKQIVSKTDAKIVLTSSWRKFWQFNKKYTDKIGEYIDEIFESSGLNIYSKTSDIDFFERDKEIDFWFRDNYRLKIESFCVLDDVEQLYKNNKFIKDHLILTNQDEGLSENDVSKAINMLNQKTCK